MGGGGGAGGVTLLTTKDFYRSGSASRMILVRSDTEPSVGIQTLLSMAKVLFLPYRTGLYTFLDLFVLNVFSVGH